MNQRELFFNYVAQTSPEPIALEIVDAKGVYVYDIANKAYMDLISGVSVSNIGHCHHEVVKAVQDQVQKYMHTNVYGEYILSPQTQMAEALVSLLPPTLNTVYFVNSGSEAIEGAMKLAKRFTGRYELISCENAYHGSTNGALSLMGNDDFTQSFRPLLPSTNRIAFGKMDDLERISHQTAAVIIEPVQGEAGIRCASNTYWKALRQRCTQTGTLLVFDEIQTGFGRTASLFAFQNIGIVPDMLTLAKAMGGGMPIGAFVASKEIMKTLMSNPVLGHITTFGGHPVSCAAALASLQVIEKQKLYEKVQRKSDLFVQYLNDLKQIKEIRRKGLLIALEFNDRELNFKVIRSCLEKGVIVDWFLFCDTALRIAPPLIISDQEIMQASTIIKEAIIENT
ncbi:MAG: aspartate aminotransferase family protein [Bacteroidales bacterium]|jgi:acetylornithine/N-succinyldiaminopimelate aminotransferase|nr:aspartate aminotransferase family protein [Bacteroidales bacterium]MDD2687493.1 aspartate aminotransferase family protein [Bacteroidales bacterium]MDD3331372.1 aspartate aminotransferase family protein [Bacteroidales bacterium]MDD3691325.1 aspartate aminotransferase family protein [Bacteroidales bacterium]MDD4044517.1 aspartate aminotransferase family protein [Bacteroidales bacterium]